MPISTALRHGNDILLSKEVWRYLSNSGPIKKNPTSRGENFYKESVMTYLNRITPGISSGKGFNNSSNRFGARGMTIAHVPKALTLTTRLSLVDRIKKQLLRSFRQNDITLQRPRSYEIQMLPASASVSSSKVLQRSRHASSSAVISALMGEPISGRYWFASKATHEKLAQTSSNLG